MSSFVIYGCGGLGLEILSYFLDMENGSGHGSVQHTYSFIDKVEARIDDARRMIGRSCVRHDRVESTEPGASFIIALGDPITRHAAFERCIEHGLIPYLLIHPQARVDRTAKVGSGTLVGPYCFIGPYAIVGQNSVVNIYASIGHDASVGMSSVLSPYATMNGSSRCGVRTFMGTHTMILPGQKLGSYSKLAAGSVLTTETSDGVLATGNPARHRVMFRKPEDL